jgi:hypothetical protein
VVVADLRSYLDDREKALQSEIMKLREQIAPLERELFEVRIAKRAVGRHSSEPLQQPLFSSTEKVAVDEQAQELWKQYRAIQAERVLSPYARLTIKELVLKALEEQFPSGATAHQLLELFSNAWGRGEIVRTSLSPQLSRLKADHKIDRDGSLWFRRNSKVDPPETKAATDQ